MTEYKTQYLSPDIKLSLYEGIASRTEVVFEHHMLVWFISGETRIVQTNATFCFGSGDIFLIPRNQLATIINYSKSDCPHKAVAMHLTTERLKDYYARHKAATGKP